MEEVMNETNLQQNMSRNSSHGWGRSPRFALSVAKLLDQHCYRAQNWGTTC